VPRILVTYATRHGSTREIASAIGEELTAAGLDVDVIEAHPGIDVHKYDAVVVGSPAYGGKWLPDAALFLIVNEQKLAGRPLALFTAGTLGVRKPRSALREHEETVKDLQQLAPDLNVISTALFHGAFSRSVLPLCLRLMDLMAGTPQGDFRDWEAIRGWGQRIAGRLVSGPPVEPGA